MKVYKGTDKDIKCRGYQFTPGVTAEEDKAELCSKGFHACEAPLDVFAYYPPANSRYFEAELEDVSPQRHSNDTKVVGKKITLGAELGIPGIVKAQIEYVKTQIDKKPNSATGYGSANSATGDGSANSATGYGSANSATGDGSANSATGARSANSATGYGSANSATGARSANSATGARSANSATGDGSANSATGDGSANSATGYGSANSATGYGSANVSTGEDCTNSGGVASINVAWGRNSKCKGEIGAFIVLSEWGSWDGNKFPLLGAKMFLIDGETYKPDTWYTLKDGEIVEVEE